MGERRLETLRGFYQNYVKPHYEAAYKAVGEGKLVAWVASTFPVEVLIAMDVVPIWPENYASICAAKRASVHLCELAERRGFSKDLCSYARCVLGSLFTEEGLPEGGLPEPNFLVASTCACDTHLKWFQVASRILRRPLFLLDVPYNVSSANHEGLEDRYVKYYASQLKGLIDLIEERFEVKLDANEFRRTIELSNKASELWLKAQGYRKNVPTPMGAREAFSAVYFMLCTPGTEEAVSFYERLCEELEERVKHGIGVVNLEKYRLIWDNLPPWFDLGLFQYLEGLGAVVVAETFSHVWAGSLNPSKPYESLAKKHLLNMANCSVERRIKLITSLVVDFKADGVILPTNWGCRMMTIGETVVKDEVQKATGVQSLILDIDSTDWRNYDERTVKAKLETYLRTLK